MEDERPGDLWLCAFCGRLAPFARAQRELRCEGRVCRCGAVGLAARGGLSPALLGDALALFAVAPEQGHRTAEAGLAALRRAGVEVRVVPGGRQRDGAAVAIWCRRPDASSPA